MTGLSSRRGLLFGRSPAPTPAPVAVIGEACLARRGVVCRSCGDACPERAIRFPPLLGHVALPVVVADACTGCGDCVAVCPVAAVTLPAVPEATDAV
jgi:ferredoxin-type protein NapF